MKIKGFGWYLCVVVLVTCSSMESGSVEQTTHSMSIHDEILTAQLQAVLHASYTRYMPLGLDPGLDTLFVENRNILLFRDDTEEDVLLPQNSYGVVKVVDSLITHFEFYNSDGIPIGHFNTTNLDALNLIFPDIENLKATFYDVYILRYEKNLRQLARKHNKSVEGLSIHITREQLQHKMDSLNTQLGYR
jgi:hypothetical protein